MLLGGQFCLGHVDHLGDELPALRPGRAVVVAAPQPAWPSPTMITSKDSVGAALKLMHSLSAPLSCSEIVPYRRKTHGHGDGDS